MEDALERLGLYLGKRLYTTLERKHLKIGEPLDSDGEIPIAIAAAAFCRLFSIVPILIPAIPTRFLSFLLYIFPILTILTYLFEY